MCLKVNDRISKLITDHWVMIAALLQDLEECLTQTGQAVLSLRMYNPD